MTKRWALGKLKGFYLGSSGLENIELVLPLAYPASQLRGTFTHCVKIIRQIYGELQQGNTRGIKS